MKKEKRLFHRVASLMLAVVMVFSIVGIIPQDVRAAEYVLPAKGGTISITDATCSAVTGQIDYWKYTPSQDGYLELKFANASQGAYATGQVQLYNSSRKFITPIMTYTTSSIQKTDITEYYGVQKGKTYYIGVLSKGGVNITATFKKLVLKKKAGAKKNKAINIPKGKKGATGTIAAGTKASCWYKIKLTKSKQINISMTPYLTSSVSFTLSGPGVYKRTFTVPASFWGDTYPISTTGKVRPGTYYVQVKPASQLSTGYYKLTWK